MTLFCFCAGLICGWAPVFQDIVAARIAVTQLKDETYVGYCERGIERLDRGEYKSAIEDFNKSIQLNPKHGRAFNNRGNAEEYLNDYQSALKDFTRAIDLKYWNGYYNRAALRSKLGDKPGAIADLTQSIRHKNLLIDSHARRGWEYELLGDKRASQADFLIVKKCKPSSGREFGNKAWVLAHLGDHVEAIRGFNESLRLRPRDAWTLDRRGLSKQALGNNAGAIQDFEEASRLNPDFGDAHYDLGCAKARARNWKGAVRAYDRAIVCDRSEAIYYSARGDACFNLGDYSAAKADYLMRLKLDAAHPAYPLQWIAATQFELGEFEEALEQYNKAIRVEPKNEFLWAHRAACRLKLKDDSGARSDVNEAIRLNPKYSWAYLCRGRVRNVLEDKQGAISDFSECIRLDNNAAYAYAYRAQLRSEVGDICGVANDFCSWIRTSVAAIPQLIQKTFH